MNLLENNKSEDLIELTIEQKLEEAIQDFEEKRIYTEKEVWKLLSDKYKFDL